MIRFTDPPTSDLEAPRLLRVKPGPELRVQLLNEKYVGIDTHYWGGHTIACPGEATCKACRQGLISVWGGFIFCQLWGGGRIAVLALTPVMAANMLLHRDETHGLLGMKVALSRKTKEPNSGVLTRFHSGTKECDRQSMERLIMRVRIIFKDYVIQDSGQPNESIAQTAI